MDMDMDMDGVVLRGRGSSAATPEATAGEKSAHSAHYSGYPPPSPQLLTPARPVDLLSDLKVRMPLSHSALAHGHERNLLLTSQQAADHLVSVFFEQVHSSWPIVEEATFKAKYHQFKSDRGVGAGGWEALLYMAMAVAATHVQLPQGSGNVSHGVFFSRSEALRRDSLYGTAVLATIAEVETSFLRSLYLALNKSLVRSRQVHDYAWSCLGSLLLRRTPTGRSAHTVPEVRKLCRRAIIFTQWLRIWTEVSDVPVAHMECFGGINCQAGHSSQQSISQSQILELNSNPQRSNITVTIHSQSSSISPSQPSGPIALSFDEPIATPSQVLRHRLDIVCHETFARMYGRTQLPLQWTQIKKVESELLATCNLILAEAKENWLGDPSGAAWSEEERSSISLIYLGFRMLLMRAYLHSWKLVGSKLSAPDSSFAVSEFFDSAYRIIHLVSATPSILNLMSLPCWWCHLPFVYLAAKTVHDEALNKSASGHLLPEDMNRQSLLVGTWLHTFRCFQEGAGELNNELIYDPPAMMVSPVLLSPPEFPDVGLNQLLSNNQAGGSSNLSVQLLYNPHIGNGRSCGPLTDEPMTVEPSAPIKPSYRTYINLCSGVETFKAHLGINDATYHAMMEECRAVRNSMDSDVTKLKKRNTSLPYRWSDYTDRAKGEACRLIHLRASHRTRPVFDLAQPYSNSRNWIANWMLYHRFQYPSDRTAPRRERMIQNPTFPLYLAGVWPVSDRCLMNPRL